MTTTNPPGGPGMSRPSERQDPRAERLGICGITCVIGRTEWICIKAVHDDPPRPGRGHRSAQPNNRGYAARSERHYFVARYPWRDRA